MMKLDLPVKSFSNSKAWAAWLARNHAKSSGLWLKLAKKSSGLASVSYAEALDEALCWGWIDSQKRGLDERFWLQRFTPRGPKSIWSKINTGHVKRLKKARRMKPAGLKAVMAAKADGRWKAAYHGQRTATVPADFKAALKKNKKAAAFFDTLKSADRYILLFKLQTTKKAETRARKIPGLIRMLERKKAFHFYQKKSS